VRFGSVDLPVNSPWSVSDVPVPVLLLYRLKMTNFFEFLLAPLAVFEGLGLTPLQAFVVIAMLTSGIYVKWTYQHSLHDHDHDH
jgi:hypothetical protein